MKVPNEILYGRTGYYNALLLILRLTDSLPPHFGIISSSPPTTTSATTTSVDTTETKKGPTTRSHSSAESSSGDIATKILAPVVRVRRCSFHCFHVLITVVVVPL
jgi:hypothetical protein